MSESLEEAQSIRTLIQSVSILSTGLGATKTTGELCGQAVWLLLSHINKHTLCLNVIL